MPLRSGATKPYLGAIVFAADGTTRNLIRQNDLGGSERKFFVAGETPVTIAALGQRIGLAICADSSQPSHPQSYAESGAIIYAAGVFLNAEWYATDSPRLADYALRHRMLVVMANDADSIGTYKSVGKKARHGCRTGTLLRRPMASKIGSSSPRTRAENGEASR